MLSSGSVVSLTPSTSPSKHSSSVRKTHSIHSPSSYRRRPSSAEHGAIRDMTRKKTTPQSPLRHALRSGSKENAREGGGGGGNGGIGKKQSQWSPVNHEATPGSAEWEYYAEPVPPTMVKGLADKWPAIEKTYITTLKQIFQILREERECICQYFFLRRYNRDILNLNIVS